MDRRQQLLQNNQGGDGLEGETLTLVSAMSTAPSGARILLINNVIKEFKRAGIWTRLDLLYMFAAHEAPAARLNWITPDANTLAEVNSPTFTADQGYTGDGVSSRLVGSYTNTNYLKDSASLGCFVLTDSTNTAYEVGIMNAATVGRGAIRARTTGSQYNITSNTINIFSASDAVPKLVAVNRSDAGNATPYTNGVAESSQAQTSIALGTLENVYFLSAGGAGYSDRKVAFGFVGASLTTDQHAAINTVVRAYLTAVGAI